MNGRLSAAFRDRTKTFAARVIRLFVKLPRQRDEVNILGRQLLRSGTSVAAQVREAGRARSKDEFVSKLGGAAQEADESQLWLELLQDECAIRDPAVATLHTEAGELIAIFVTMINRTRESGRVKSES
jgi:four helix bundle protein